MLKHVLFPYQRRECGEVAQMVEQGTENPRVMGSIPFLATIFFEGFGDKLPKPFVFA
jgi:hypothetical protein